ncbi:MAG: RNA polymerase sigma factor [Solirubrobacterales bacterium]
MSELDRDLERLGDSPALRRAAVAAELFEDHAPALLGGARAASLCAADAEDALQRGLEVFLREGPVGTSDRPLAWLRVVIRNEAILVRKRRERLLGVDGEPRPERTESPCGHLGPLQRLLDRERSKRAAGILAPLKHDQRRALALQAAGCSYAEIAAICDWTYTKVNRSISEGRASLAPLG